MLLLALAGSLGTLSRYAVGTWVGRLGDGRFPYGTLTVNLVGCFVLGLLSHGLLKSQTVPADVRLALTTGFLGAFTTFSTFSVESVGLLNDGRHGAWLAYLGASIGVGLLAAWSGLALARTLAG